MYIFNCNIIYNTHTYNIQTDDATDNVTRNKSTDSMNHSYMYSTYKTNTNYSLPHLLFEKEITLSLNDSEDPPNCALTLLGKEFI